jgi:hypothetical protein
VIFAQAYFASRSTAIGRDHRHQRALSADDGDISDWALTWEEWKALAVT